jgi:hypothetical protein
MQDLPGEGMKMAQSQKQFGSKALIFSFHVLLLITPSSVTTSPMTLLIDAFTLTILYRLDSLYQSKSRWPLVHIGGGEG